MPSGPPEPPAKGDPRADVTGALHDVSNALTVLLGWASEAREEGAPPETVRYALQLIETRARMARDLARRAIGVAVPEADAEEDLDVVLADVTDALAVEASRRRVSIRRIGGIPGARIPSAQDASHVVTNLVLNALAYAPPGSTVLVTCRPEGAGVAVEVQDDGPGIPAERRSTLFDGTSTREGGAGVGLRHARAHARAASGDLRLVDSPRGARFLLTWPRVGARMPPPPPSISRIRLLEGKRVLVVEDDADVVELLDTALTARGATLEIARTAAELNALLCGPPHDAALLDLSPIAKDVAAAVTAVKRHSPDAILVFITGSAGGLPDVVAPGTLRWVRKPFEVSEIVSALVGAPPRKP